MAKFGSCIYTADPQQTRLAYSQAASGGADRCECAGCRNFRVSRPGVFPPDFLALLDRLGIDPAKDAEVHHNGRRDAGRHDYGGWFHFCGTLVEPGDAGAVKLGDGFTARLCHAAAPRLPSLNGRDAVQLEFHAENVPWLLDDPEPV